MFFRTAFDLTRHFSSTVFKANFGVGSHTAPVRNATQIASGITILAAQTPIAQGRVRQIWDRPGYPDQVLKTIQPGKRAKFAKRSRLRRALDDIRFGPYRTFRIEYRYYARTAFKCLKAQRPNPIAEMGGLIATDQGLAQICEKITDASGALASTLKVLVEANALDDQKLRWLNECIETLFVLNISVPDLSAENIVFDEVRQRCLVVDGYGDKAKIPFRTWIAYLNRAKLDFRISNKIAIPGRLEWDSQTRRFFLP